MHLTVNTSDTSFAGHKKRSTLPLAQCCVTETWAPILSAPLSSAIPISRCSAASTALGISGPKNRKECDITSVPLFFQVHTATHSYPIRMSPKSRVEAYQISVQDSACKPYLSDGDEERKIPRPESTVTGTACDWCSTWTLVVDDGNNKDSPPCCATFVDSCTESSKCGLRHLVNAILPICVASSCSTSFFSPSATLEPPWNLCSSNAWDHVRLWGAIS